MANHLDPKRQAKGALQKIWSDWTFSNKKTRKEAYKAISRENAHRMIDTMQMLRNDRFEAYQSGRLSVYIEEKAGKATERRVRGGREVPVVNKTEARNLGGAIPTAPRQPEKLEGPL